MRLGNCGNVAIIATLSDKSTGFGMAVEVKSITINNREALSVLCSVVKHA